MTVRDKLHQIIDHLPEEDIGDVLDYPRWLVLESDTLSDEEWADVRAGEEQMASQRQFSHA